MGLLTCVAIFSACSVTMNVVNKMVAVRFKCPHQVLSLQFAVATLLLSPYANIQHGWKQWALTIPVLFLIMLLSSYYALQRVSLGSFVITRNITPAITYVLEYTLLKIEKRYDLTPDEFELSTFKMAMLVGLASGIVCYEWDNVKYDKLGLIALLVNTLSSSVERVVQKWLMKQRWMMCDHNTLSFINNAVSFCMLFTYALYLSTRERSASCNGA